MLARGIPESELGTANIRWNQYTKGRDEGSSPIFTSNANYKDNVTKVLKAVEESFKPIYNPPPLLPLVPDCIVLYIFLE